MTWAAKYTGTSNFSVEVIDPKGALAALLVNNVGAYAGTGAVHLDAASYSLKIDGDGSWNVAIAQPRHQVALALPQTLKGQYPQVLGPFTIHGGARLAATHDGNANFVVEVLDEDGALQDASVNTIGAYNGSTTVGDLDGVYYVTVTSDGHWAVALSAL